MIEARAPIHNPTLSENILPKEHATSSYEPAPQTFPKESHPITINKPPEFSAAPAAPSVSFLPTEKASLLPNFSSFLKSVNLRPEYIHPIPLGQGANHVVFSYQEPGEEEKVIKIPKAGSPISMVSGKYEEDAGIKTIQSAFPGYTLPTEIREDTATGQYCVVQKLIRGKPVTNHNNSPSIQKQVEEIAKLNRELMKNQDLSLDFIGIPGFKSWLRRQFAKLFFKQKEFEVSNLIIDEHDGKVYIIDYDFFQFKNTSFKKKIISYISLFTNRTLMKRYFGVDIKG